MCVCVMFTYFILVSSPKLYPFFLHFILNITWKFSSHKSHTFSKCFADHHIWRHIQNSRFRWTSLLGRYNFPLVNKTDYPCVFMQLFIFLHHNFSLQFTSVAQSCLTVCDTMDCSTPGLPLHHKLPDRAQTHVHWVSDIIQPSHSLSSSFPPAFNLSQH